MKYLHESGHEECLVLAVEYIDLHVSLLGFRAFSRCWDRVGLLYIAVCVGYLLELCLAQIVLVSCRYGVYGIAEQPVVECYYTSVTPVVDRLVTHSVNDGIGGLELKYLTELLEIGIDVVHDFPVAVSPSVDCLLHIAHNEVEVAP